MKQVKKYLFPLLIFGSILACSGNQHNSPEAKVNLKAQSDSANYTSIVWKDSIQDFGTIKFGKKVKVVYHFMNSGNKPLFITEVRPTCGCTVADFTKDAVLPGQEGKVEAEFDSNHGVPGSIRKSIVVSSNTTNDTHFVLAFTGIVK